jgi:hypothetical protein
LEVARGEFLVFLNNDAVVTDGWLDQLIALTRVRVASDKNSVIPGSTIATEEAADSATGGDAAPGRPVLTMDSQSTPTMPSSGFARPLSTGTEASRPRPRRAGGGS